MARIELLNAMQVCVCNAYSKLGLAEQPTLFVEFHGTPASIAEQSERFGAFVGEYGGGPFDWSQEPRSQDPALESKARRILGTHILSCRCQRRGNRRLCGLMAQTPVAPALAFAHMFCPSR